MQETKVIARPAASLHTLKGRSVSDEKDPSYKEYRRLWGERPKTFTEGNFPLFLDIEVTNLCNYKCPFCATTYLEKHMKKGFIKPKLVKKIIDEGSEKGLYGVKFNDRGEPLLCKELEEYVRYAKKKGLIDVYFNTNAALMDEKVSQWIIESGLDRISISCEGTTPKVYEKYRVGGKFKTVYNNIANLKKLRDRRKSKTPRIRIQTVMLDELKGETDKYADFWYEVSDEVCYLDYKEEANQKDRVDPNNTILWACPELWQRMGVLWDGTILPCNEDGKARLVIGNAKEMTIEEAWKSEFINKLRKKHKVGKSGEINACKACGMRDSELRKFVSE